MLDRARKNPKITLLTNTVVEEILGVDAVTGVRLHNVKTQESFELRVAGVFMGIGHQPNTALFAGQLDLDDAGYIKTLGRSTRTNVEGVFAAGDVQDHHYRQAITAAGSGCMAAIEAERFIEANKI
jgi:thioredoxin reductase (NADPH)